MRRNTIATVAIMPLALSGNDVGSRNLTDFAIDRNIDLKPDPAAGPDREFDRPHPVMPIMAIALMPAVFS